jgi:hypothetical protein
VAVAVALELAGDEPVFQLGDSRGMRAGGFAAFGFDVFATAFLPAISSTPSAAAAWLSESRGAFCFDVGKLETFTHFESRPAA